MGALLFEWDPRKSAANKRKHGVSFEEARSVFTDEHGLLLDDPDHSEGGPLRPAGHELLGPNARRLPLLPARRRHDPHHLRTTRERRGAC
jgi:hypothetical protein